MMRNSAAARVLGLDAKVNPAWTALVIVDVQNDFAKPSGACEQSGDDLVAIDPMIERLKALIEIARRKQILIIHLRMNNDLPYVAPNLAEVFLRRGLGAGPCRGHSYGAQFVDGVQPAGIPNEIVLTKHRFSGFWGTSIDLMLRSNGIKALVMAGIASEVCVDSTARDGFFRDYDVVVAADCTASFSAARHEACHSLFGRSFGMVATSAEIADAWQGSNAIARGWDPGEKQRAILATLEQRVAPDHTALVLIGMQTGYFDETRPGRSPTRSLQRLHDMRPRAKAMLDRARQAGVMVIHAQFQCGPEAFNVGAPGDYVNDAGPEPSVRTLSAVEIGDPGRLAVADVCRPGAGEFLDDFKPLENEPVVTSHRFSAFCDTDLDLLLRANGIRTVVLIGQDTDCGVDTTAREATMRDYYLVIPEDCVADEDASTSRHEASLATLRRFFGLVTSSQRIASAWSANLPVS
jgi:nicotinamidase-related amidase